MTGTGRQLDPKGVPHRPWDQQTLPRSPFGSSSSTTMSSSGAGSRPPPDCAGHRDRWRGGQRDRRPEPYPGGQARRGAAGCPVAGREWIDVCREIRSTMPQVKCLILTSYDDDDALFAAVMAGAAGYLLKQVGGSDVVAGIRAVAQGKSLIDPSLTGKLLTRLRNPPAPAREEEDPLSPREHQILELITEGCTNRQIGERLYLAEKTVKNYVSSLLTKLGMERRTQAAVYGAQHRLEKRTPP